MAHKERPDGYPCTIRWDTDIFISEFPDFPEAHGYGDTPEESLKTGAECLDAAIAFRREKNEAVPEPSRIYYVLPRNESLEDAADIQAADERLAENNGRMSMDAMRDCLKIKIKNPNRMKAGYARAAALSPERRKEIASLAGNERWRRERETNQYGKGIND